MLFLWEGFIKYYKIIGVFIMTNKQNCAGTYKVSGYVRDDG